MKQIRFAALNVLTRWKLYSWQEKLPTCSDASPIFAEVTGLAPVLIYIGENEVMLNDASDLASPFAENRVRTSLNVRRGTFHVWHLFAGLLAEADHALHNAVRFLQGVCPVVSSKEE